MKFTPKVVSRRVGLLKEPDPKYVSIVTHGANQTPFASVKSAHKVKGEQQMPIAKRTTKKTTEAAPAAAKKATAGVLKLKFSKENFTVAEVRKYLTENKIDNCKIVKGDDVIEAVSEVYKEDDFSEIKEVPAEEGVIALVGKIIEGRDGEKEEGDDDSSEEGDGDETATGNEDDEEGEGDEEGNEDDDEDESEQKSATKSERVIKLDWWDMYDSKGETVSGVIKDGMSDGIPPGAGEIMAATQYAVGNVLGGSDDAATKRSKLASIGADFANLLADTYDVFAEATESAEKSENVAKFIKDFGAEMQALAKSAKPPVKKVDPKAPAKKTDDEGKTDRLDEDALAALIGSAVKSAVEPLQKSLDAMGRKVDNASTTSKNALTAATKAATAVEEIAARAPSRKSVSQEEPGNGTKNNTAQKVKDGNTEFAQKIAAVIGL